MFQTLVNAFKNKDIRKKILITIGLLLIYRLGCWLQLPGVSPSWYDAGAEGADTFLGLLSAVTGGALQNGAFLAIGISPYINASIIVQLLTIAIKPLEEWSKQGDDGRKKLATLTRILTLVLAVMQSAGIVVSMNNTEGAISNSIYSVAMPNWLICIFIAIMLIAGCMFTMWLGERITDYGIGNGISLLIFVGILATAGQSMLAVIMDIPTRDTAVWELIGFLAMVILIFAFIVFVDAAERRVPIQYAKQIKGRKQYGGQSTNIPIKLNASGVLPIIFSTAIITLPQLICSIFAPTSAFYGWWMKWLGTGTPIYFVLTGLLILGFSYFYAKIQFNPEDVARNIQQYGGFIPGIRPGRPTAEYLARISNRLTLFGAIFLAIIAIVPSIIFSIVLPTGTLVNAFSATGLLIVVSVALEFDKQLESQLMMKQYKGFLS